MQRATKLKAASIHAVHSIYCYLISFSFNETLLMKVNGMVTCFNTVPPTSYLFYRLVLALKNINWHFKNMVRFQLQLKRQKKRNE